MDFQQVDCSDLQIVMQPAERKEENEQEEDEVECIDGRYVHTFQPDYDDYTSVQCNDATVGQQKALERFCSPYPLLFKERREWMRNEDYYYFCYRDVRLCYAPANMEFCVTVTDMTVQTLGRCTWSTPFENRKLKRPFREWPFRFHQLSGLLWDRFKYEWYVTALGLDISFDAFDDLLYQPAHVREHRRHSSIWSWTVLDRYSFWIQEIMSKTALDVWKSNRNPLVRFHSVSSDKEDDHDTILWKTSASRLYPALWNIVGEFLYGSPFSLPPFGMLTL